MTILVLLNMSIACKQIRHMEHAIEHETLPLKEEKQLIRDIKQLRNVREQLSSNMGKQEEVQQALDQKSQVEEQSKVFISDIFVFQLKFPCMRHV